MIFSNLYDRQGDALSNLFNTTLTAAEGMDEGAVIGRLVQNLLVRTPDMDMRVFTVLEDGIVAGGIIFTQLRYNADTRTVFLLAPVAIAPKRQRKGLGTRLISYGLQSLRDEGVDVVVTYGDPAFYSRVGFTPVAESQIPAPYKLQHPEGWLGQSLNDVQLTSLCGPVHCVAAFRDPAYW